MRRIPESKILEIREKSDIVEVVARYIPLSKKGKNFVGLCPFHLDSDPSMTVSPEKQIYKCFVCGSGGNVFQFVSNYEKISFVDSVLELAQFAHVEMDGFKAVQEVVVDPQTQILYDLLNEAANYCSFQLFTQAGEQALQVVHRRGYQDDLLKDFGVGVVLRNKQLTDFLLAKGFQEKDLLRADISREGNSGLEDVFESRIMFPISDEKGRVVGFSARTLLDGNYAKYINTKETDLYTKGNILYNYFRAKEFCKKDRVIIITEGVTDSFAFHQSSMKNVVSLLGVACTPRHIKLIKHVANHVILAFDGDQAGIDATYKIGSILKESQLEVSVWYNNTGKDPDETYREFGADKIREGINQKLTWIDFLIQYSVQLYGVHSFEAKSSVIEFMIPHLRLENEISQDYYAQIIASKTGFDKELILRQIPNNQPVNTIRQPIAQKEVHIGAFIIEKDILLAMLSSKRWAWLYRDELGYLVNDAANELSLIILDCYRHQETLKIADVLSKDLSDQAKDLLMSTLEVELMSVLNETQLLDAFSRIKDLLFRLGMRAVTTEINQTMDENEQLRLLEEAIIKQRRSNG